MKNQWEMENGNRLMEREDNQEIVRNSDGIIAATTSVKHAKLLAIFYDFLKVGCLGLNLK